MTAIPPNTCTMQDIYDWYTASEELAALKNREMLLRRKVFEGKFPEPVEGTNSEPLQDGWVLKCKYGYNRTPDMEAFSTLADELRAAGVVLETLIKYKPELAITAYRELTKEQQQLVDQCLIVKPSSPSLEIVMPKRASKSVGANEVLK